jgi:hypothetical protein
MTQLHSHPQQQTECVLLILLHNGSMGTPALCCCCCWCWCISDRTSSSTIILSIAIILTTSTASITIVVSFTRYYIFVRPSLLVRRSVGVGGVSGPISTVSLLWGPHPQRLPDITPACALEAGQGPSPPHKQKRQAAAARAGLHA